MNKANRRLEWVADKIEHWPINRIAPNARNARTHSDAQIAQIAKSIQEFGFTNPLLIGSDGVIISGHGRLEAAKRIGMAAVPVIVIDHLTPTQRRALALADNRLSEISEWDDMALADEIESLLTEGFDMDTLGFSEVDLDRLIGDLSAAEVNVSPVKDSNAAAADIEEDDVSIEDTNERQVTNVSSSSNDAAPSSSGMKEPPPVENKTFYPVLFYLNKSGFDRWSEWKKRICIENNAEALDELLRRVL